MSARLPLRLLFLVPLACGLAKDPAVAQSGWHYAVEPRFQAADVFSGGRAAVKFNNHWGLIDTKGRWVVKPVHEDMRGGGEGLHAVRKGKLWGFIDLDGRQVVPHRYLDAGSFAEGYAPVKVPKGWRVIDRRGVEMFRQSYTALSGFSEGLAVAKNGKTLGFLRRGDWKFIPVKDADKLYSLSEGLAVAVVKNRRGFVNARGKLVIRPIYQAATRFTDGHAGVRIKGKWAVIDRKGRVVLNRAWKDMRSFSEGWTAYRTAKGLWGYSAADGKSGLPPRYTNAFAFRDGIAIVRAGKKRYFIDRRGRHLTEPVFDDVFRFSEGLAPVKQGALWGYIALGKPKAQVKKPPNPLDLLMVRLDEGAQPIQDRLRRWDEAEMDGLDFDPENPNHGVRGWLGADRTRTERALDDAIARLLAMLPADGGKSLGTDGPPRIAGFLDQTARLLYRETRYGRAERLALRAQDIMENAAVNDPKGAGERGVMILDGRLRRGDMDAAAQALAALDRIEPEQRRALHNSVVASLENAIGQMDPAELDGPRMARLYEMLVAVQARDLGPDHPDTLLAHIRQARIHFLAGQRDKAKQAYDRLLPMLWPDLEKRYIPIHWTRREMFRNLGLIAAGQDRQEEAEAFLKLADGFADTYALAETNAAHPQQAIIPGVDLARLYEGRGNGDQALSLLSDYLEKPDAGARLSDRQAQLAALVGILLDQGRRDEAEAAFEKYARRLGPQAAALRRNILGN